MKEGIPEDVQEEYEWYSVERSVVTASGVMGAATTPELAELSGKVLENTSPEEIGYLLEAGAEVPELFISIGGAAAAYGAASYGVQKAGKALGYRD